MIERTRFLGVHEAVSGKGGRLTLPKRFRAGLGDRVALICLPHHALTLLPIALWDEIKSEIPSSADGERPDFAVVSVDVRGRIALPRTFCQWADIAPHSPLVIVGLGQKVEIWSHGAWEQFRLADSKLSEDAVEKLK